VEKYWNPAVEGKCLNRNIITYVNAGVNIGSDLTLLAIPIPLLKNLHIPRRQKFILVGVFLCGALACTMSIIRLRSLYEIGHAPPARQSSKSESMPRLEHVKEPKSPLTDFIFTVEGVNIAIWSCIEINVGIVCASVPALKALAAKVFPKILLSGIYSRSRFRNGRYVRQHSENDNEASGGGAGAQDGGSSASSSDPKSAKRPHQHITVQQSFEMNTFATTEQMPRVPEQLQMQMQMQQGQPRTRGERQVVSQDGSEKMLIRNSYIAGCYAGPVREDLETQ
jgi:hypothetical protein